MKKLIVNAHFSKNHQCNYTKTIIIQLRHGEYRSIKTEKKSRFYSPMFTEPSAHKCCNNDCNCCILVNNSYYCFRVHCNLHKPFL